MASKPTSAGRPRLAQSLATVLAATGGVTPVSAVEPTSVPPLDPSGAILPLGATLSPAEDDALSEEAVALPQAGIVGTAGQASRQDDPQSPTADAPSPAADAPSPAADAPSPAADAPSPAKVEPDRKSGETDKERKEPDKERVALEAEMTLFRSEWIRYTERRLGVEDAQDAMSEVWKRFWEAREKVKSPREWMYGCLRIVIRDMSDPAKRREIHLAHVDPAPADESPEAPQPNEVSLDRLIEVTSLSDAEREALRLRREGVAVRVIAKRLDINFRAAEALLFRARVKLKEHYAAGNVMLELREE